MTCVHVAIVTRLVYMNLLLSSLYCIICFVAYLYTRTSRKRSTVTATLDSLTCGDEPACALHPQE